MTKINVPQFSAKPTTKKEPTSQGKSFEKNFKKTMNNHNVELGENVYGKLGELDEELFIHEIDNLLEKEQLSIKKDIWDLSKMESLVHSDPKLSGIYNNMAEDGEEKYGYHYNETIMNIIFNEYVIDNPEYLQKYKNSVPVKKKRRDKSGITQLQKEKGNDDSKEKKEKKEEGYNHNNSLEGVMESDPNSDRGYLDQRIKKKYDIREGVNGLKSIPSSLALWFIGTVMNNVKHPIQGMHQLTMDQLKQSPPEYKNKLFAAIKSKIKSGEISNDILANHGFQTSGEGNFDNSGYLDGQDIEETTSAGGAPAAGGGQAFANPTGQYTGKLKSKVDEGEDPCWKGYRQLGMKKKNGKEVPDCVPEGEETTEVIDETTDSSSSGQYSTPQFAAKGTGRFFKKAAYKDGKIVGENYFTDTTAFKRLFESLDNDSIVPMAEHHHESKEDRIEFIKNKLGNMSDDEIEKIYKSIEGEMGIGESMIDDQPDSMIANNPTSMKLEDENLTDFGKSEDGLGGFNGKGKSMDSINYKEPEKFGAPKLKEEENLDEYKHCRKDEEPVPGKIQGEKGACRKKKNLKKDSDKSDENKFNLEKRKQREKEYYKKIKKKSSQDMSQNKKNDDMKEKNKNVNEDKKPSTMVMLDRLKKDNAQYFKSDMKDSNSADIAGYEARADDEYSEVKDAQKLSQDIEKEKLKQNKGESFDNVGDSTNDNNKEISKRNHTDGEQDDVKLTRNGMESWNYDNKPSERFEERMKQDMGDEMYQKRQDQMKHKASAPMYNKDPEPIQDSEINKTQFNKYEKGYNDDEKGLKESFITGKYEDIFGKKRIIDFKLSETKIVDSVEGLSKINLDGMGNTYTSRVDENVSMRDVMNSFEFYFNHETQKVVKSPTTMQRLAEGEKKKQQPVNEEYNRMKSLMGYDPHKYINNHNIKKNRGF